MAAGLAACLWESAESEEPPVYPDLPMFGPQFPITPEQAHEDAKRLQARFKTQERYTALVMDLIVAKATLPETIHELLISYHVYCEHKWLGSPTFEVAENDLAASTAECVWRVAHSPDVPTLPANVIISPEEAKATAVEMALENYSSSWLADELRLAVEYGELTELLLAENHYVFCGHDYVNPEPDTKSDG